MNKSLVWIGLAAVLGGLAWYGYSQYKKLTNLCYSFTGFEILKLNRERITIQINLRVKNESAIEIKLSSYNLKMYLNGADVATISAKKETVIKPGAFTVLSLLIDVDPKSVKGLANWDFISKILLDINNVKIRIAGTLTASVAGFGVKNYPVDIGPVPIKSMKPDKNNPSPPCV